MKNKNLTKEEIVRELNSRVDCGMPNVRQGTGNAYVLHSTNSVISSGNNEEFRQVIKALEYFESAEALLRNSTSLSDIEKAEFCNIAAKAIRDKLRKE